VTTRIFIVFFDQQTGKTVFIFAKPNLVVHNRYRNWTKPNDSNTVQHDKNGQDVLIDFALNVVFLTV